MTEIVSVAPATVGATSATEEIVAAVKNNFLLTTNNLLYPSNELYRLYFQYFLCLEDIFLKGAFLPKLSLLHLYYFAVSC